jgi:hypothetical protein
MPDWRTRWQSGIAACVTAVRDGIASGRPALAPTTLSLYGVLLLACLNPVLRPAIDIPITPYYVLMPFVAAIVLRASARLRLLSVAVVAFFLYALLLGVLAGTPSSVQLPQLLKYAQLFVLFAILYVLHRSDPHFVRRSRRLVIGVALLAFAIAGLQAIWHFEFPTVVNEESSLWLNTFFFTPNDLALFLAPVLLLVLLGRGSVLFKMAFTAAFIVLNVRNDAKAILLALSLMLLVLVCVRIGRALRQPPMLLIAGAALLTVIGLLDFADSVFEFNEQQVSALELLVEPLQRVWDLEPYNLAGSIFDRTDALIYALTELKAHHWLGLGPGGSIYVLTLPQYELVTAQSLHNAVAELAIDLGPAFVIPVMFVLLRVVARLCRRRAYDMRDVARGTLVVALPFLAVSQSSGYISNYAFWIAAYLAWYMPAVTSARLARSGTVVDAPAAISPAAQS